MDIYNIDEFKMKFLNKNFDEILLNNNNNIINSDVYLLQKNNYLNKTKENIEKLVELTTKFNILNNFYTKSDDKNIYTYHYINTKEKDEYNNMIKNIYKEQQYIYNNFLNYINILNKK